MDRGTFLNLASIALTCLTGVAGILAGLYPEQRKLFIFLTVVFLITAIWAVVQMRRLQPWATVSERPEPLTLQGFDVLENRAYQEDTEHVRVLRLRPLHGIPPSWLRVSVDAAIREIRFRLVGVGFELGLPWIPWPFPNDTARFFELPLRAKYPLNPKNELEIEIRGPSPIHVVELARIPYRAEDSVTP